MSGKVDWGLSIKLCNNREDVAKELLGMLEEELPSFKKKMASAFQKKKYDQLASLAHKLLGSCCYCGVSQLKTLLQKISDQLKKDPSTIDEKLYSQVDQEIEAVFAELKNNKHIHP